MASILISGLIPLLQQPGLMPEMEKECEKLLNFFMTTQPMLADAELCAEGDPNVRNWLVELNSVVYDTDDIVDDFRYAKFQTEAEAEADDFQNWNGCRVRAGIFPFSCFKNSSIDEQTMPSGALQGIENRIGSIVNRIDGLVERMGALNFRTGQELNITTTERQQQQFILSNPTEIRDIFVGRDEEKATIRDIFGAGVSIFIQGPHGIGKTAIARSICLSSGYYVVWVEVGTEFNIGKVTKSIIDRIIKKDCCISEDHTDLLELRLNQELSGVVRLTVVLDDVCTGFEQLLPKLKDWQKMGRWDMRFLIITSNFDEMQKYIIVDKKNLNPIILGPLMPDDGWKLFCNKAFYGDPKLETCPQRLEKGKKITGRCGGSPLALNMMGSLMRFKKEPEEWQGVIDQLEKEILLNDHVVPVETIIKVCYDNLTSQVKQCFAFCSLFPKGHYIDKEVLIKLWMANGLLLASDGSGSMPPEENGNLIFNELASRHFFENIKHDHEGYSYESNCGYHNRVTCKMLHLIRERAVIAAKEFALQIVQIPDHLPISGDSRVNIDIPLLLKTNPTVRILLSPDDPFSRTVNCSAVPKANSLRGLHLHCSLFEKDLSNLNDMRHLRYLDLSRSRIQTLPESTGTLYFLETLNLSKCLLLYQLPKYIYEKYEELEASLYR
ncbi:putative disease resistance protein RGA3 [Carex rostrata]